LSTSETMSNEGMGWILSKHLPQLRAAAKCLFQGGSN
jgi:hypothetical protein